MNRKVVYNRCYGGFSLSLKALDMLCSMGHEQALKEKEFRNKHKLCRHNSCLHNAVRHDPMIVEVVEKLGMDANGECAKLRIYDLSSNFYKISEYDGMESVEETDTINWIDADKE